MNIKYQKSNIKNMIFVVIYSLTFVAPLLGNDWKTHTNANFINDIIGDSTYLYCATQGGFTIFSISESSFINTYTNVDGLPANRISCLITDKWGKIWIGTYRGISVFDPTTKIFTNYPRLGTPEQNVITCFLGSGDTVLVGTKSGLFIVDTKGTNSFSDDSITSVVLPRGFSSEIFSLQGGDYFWVGVMPGIIKLNHYLQIVSSDTNPFGRLVKAMTVVFDTLYIASERGIAKYNGSVFIPIIYFPEHYAVFDLAYIDNKFYIATTGGLLQYDWQNLWFIFNEEVRGIFISDGLWLGIGGLPWLGGGLANRTRFSDRNYHNSDWKIYQSPGLISNNVACAISDIQGSIYAVHYPTYTNNFRKVSCKKFGDDWQMICDTLIDNYLAAVDKDNRIWFGHWARDAGVSSYNPLNNTWGVITWPDLRGVIGALGIDNNNVKWTYNQYGTVIAIDSIGTTTREFTIPGLTELDDGGYEFAFDLRNRVWLGTPVGLLMIDYNNTLSAQSDDTYRIHQQGLLEPKKVYSVAVDAENRVWCATSQGAALLNNDTFRIYNTNNFPQILSNDIRRIKTDSWGNVWFLSLEGLSRYNIYSKDWTTYTKQNSNIIPNYENDDNFYRWLFVDDKQGFLLISTKEGISQFTYKALAPVLLSKIRIFPNPFIVSEHQVITFDSLPENSTIDIYTVTGKYIIKLSSNPNFAGIRWAPKGVASGIYLAVINAGKESQIIKFAIIR